MEDVATAKKDTEPATAEILQLFDAARLASRRVPPATDEELLEWRMIRPQLLTMLDEWKQLRSKVGCPLMAKILDGDS